MLLTIYLYGTVNIKHIVYIRISAENNQVHYPLPFIIIILWRLMLLVCLFIHGINKLKYYSRRTNFSVSN